MRPLTPTTAFALTLLLASYAPAEPPRVASGEEITTATAPVRLAVSGTGIHFFSSAILHSSSPTPTGVLQRSTETVELFGDLRGRLLYQPTSEIDLAAGKLVNTGHQVFSGSLLGSRPVLLHDDNFRFEVYHATGATTGEVHLVGRLAGPRIRCDLAVVGTGLTADGDATFDYTGECTNRPGPKRRRADAAAPLRESITTPR